MVVGGTVITASPDNSQLVCIIVAVISQSNIVVVVVVVGRGIGFGVVVVVVVGIVLSNSPTNASNVASPFTESQHPFNPE